MLVESVVLLISLFIQAHDILNHVIWIASERNIRAANITIEQQSQYLVSLVYAWTHIIKCIPGLSFGPGIFFPPNSMNCLHFQHLDVSLHSPQATNAFSISLGIKSAMQFVS